MEFIAFFHSRHEWKGYTKNLTFIERMIIALSFMCLSKSEVEGWECYSKTQYVEICRTHINC